MTPEVWADEIRWIFGGLLLALIVWVVVAVKWATVGKGEWLSRFRLFHRTH